MTNVNADSATDTGLPVLLRYIDDVQNKAVRLAAVMNAIAFIENEGRCSEGRTALTYLAEDLAAEIVADLDRVNLPRVAS